MKKLIKGDVVVVPFPFSDLKSTARRPALVISQLKGDDLILCQITTQSREDMSCVTLEEKDFKKGKLKINSFIRPSKIFTLDNSIVLYRIGKISEDKMREVIKKIQEIINH